MLRSLTGAAALVAGVSFFADVMPFCGRRERVVQAPWEECGDHGPRWHGECRAPASCFRVEEGFHCTMPCKQDADCSVLGSGFTCGGKGTPYAESSADAQTVCKR